MKKLKVILFSIAYSGVVFSAHAGYSPYETKKDYLDFVKTQRKVDLTQNQILGQHADRMNYLNGRIAASQTLAVAAQNAMPNQLGSHEIAGGIGFGFGDNASVAVSAAGYTTINENLSMSSSINYTQFRANGSTHQDIVPGVGFHLKY